ncbi:hypothetical protein NA57DRAFT_75148 [Rhizodiscina lignyota]|uniref:Uncharacterized protein n=1 Tax=Rhizodiscina lignyota TaxID=1504668 RepID=A0A9P4II04_9PEZI|nr:hypothetical protein NA57DRAFT_75148 [Rhizodiscina lignyota]
MKLSSLLHLESNSRQPFDPSYRFHTSWLLTPLALSVVRATFALYIFTSTFFFLGVNSTHGDIVGIRHSFSYFSGLSLWGVGIYFGIAAIHSGSYTCTGKPLLEHWPHVLQMLHSMLYSTVVIYPFLINTIYWIAIYRPPFIDTQDAWQTMTYHVLNSMFTFLEIILARTDPLPWTHVIWMLLILAMYLSLGYLIFATQHFLVYSFPNSEATWDGSIAKWIFIVATATVAIFVTVNMVIWTRRWVTETLLGMTGNFADYGANGMGSRDIEAMKAGLEAQKKNYGSYIPSAVEVYEDGLGRT